MSIRKFLLYLLLACFSTSCANEESEPSIESEEIEEPEEDVVVAPASPFIAHRGCWSGDSLPQNSVAAFRKALQQDIYGSEFDVYETSDGQIVVNHDATYGGMEITKNPYEELSKHHLSNGEPLPLFEDFLKVYIETDTHVRMIVELKSCNVDNVVTLLKQYGVLSKASFISFSKTLCNQLVERGLGQVTYYLGGNLTPHDISKLGYGGIDYSYKAYQSQPTWINEAKALGLKVAVWTINDIDMINSYLADSVLVTTDMVMTVLQEQKKE